MKTPLRSFVHETPAATLQWRVVPLVMALGASLAAPLTGRGADIFWDGGPAGTGSVWLTDVNWNPDVIPTELDNAIFDAAGTSDTVTINMNNAGGLQRVGSITLGFGNAIGRTIRNNSTTSSGSLELNGVGGQLLVNNSAASLTLLNQFGTSLPMRVRLANSGEVFVGQDGTSAQILISSSIEETNGPRGFTKTGPGILYLQGTNNTFTGPITNLAGSIKVNAAATFGDGTAPVYMDGGYIISGADRSGGVPLSNPIIMSTDAVIFTDGGLSGTSRTLPFSGPFSGTAGTLIIANRVGGTVTEQTFQLRLLGGFTFDRPIIVGSVVDTPGNFSVLQLYNPATNGVQTFTGDISGVGQVRREGAASSAGGTTIFAGNNSYLGGTRISYGTLLANNPAGSALGFGLVIVTNQGVLGGNGTVLAPVEASLGGTLSPGAAASSIGSLEISDLTLGEGGSYLWQITSATGTAGTAWDLITCGSGWNSASSATNPFTIKVDSLGVAPAGWDPSTARTWTLIQSGSATGFSESQFAIDTTAFAGTIQGFFSVSVVSGSLRLNYTPAADLIVNVPSGTQTQGEAGFPLLTGPFGVLKVGNGEAVFTNALNDYLGSTRILAGTATLPVDALNGAGAFGPAATAVELGNNSGSASATLNINTAGVTMGRSVVVVTGSTGIKTLSTAHGSGTSTFAGDIILQDNAVFSTAAGGEAVVSGVIGGSGGLTKTGSGALTLGANNIHSGGTTLTAGTLNIGGQVGTGTFAIAGSSTINNPGPGARTLTTAANEWSGDFSFLGTANLSFGSAPLTVSGSRTVNVAAGTLTVAGPVGGPGGVTKLGAGILALTAGTPSSFNGGVTLAEGLMTIGANTTLGDGTLTFAGGTFGLTGTRNTTTGILPNPIVITADTIIQNTTTAATGSRFLPFGGVVAATGGTLTIRNIAAANNNVMVVRLHGGGFTFARPVIFDNSLAGSPVLNTARLGFYNTNGSGTQIFSGNISGPGSIQRGSLAAGTGGTTILSGTNSYTLGTVLSDGSLGLGSDPVLAGLVIQAGPVGTGTFEWTADSAVFASGGPRTLPNYVFLNGVRDGQITGSENLAFAGIMNVGTVAKGFTVENTGRTTFAGVLTNSAPLYKSGAGTLELSAANLNAGGWTVSNGTLLVNNTLGSGTGDGDVIVTGPGTVGGTGIIAGGVSGDGLVAPGESAGVLTVEGGLDLSAGGTLVWELAANSTNNPGTDFDLLSLTGGNLVLGGASKLSIHFTGSATAPDAGNPFWQSSRSWTVVSLAGTATNDGSTVFAAIENGAYPAGSFTNYADTNGNIILAFEPSGVAASPEIISSSRLPDGNFSLGFSGTVGVGYSVRASTNVALPYTNWTVLGTGTFGAGPVTFNDLSATNFPQRFYLISVP